LELQDGAGAVGSSVRSASPLPSTATHSDSEGQETALGALPESNATGDDDQVSDGLAWAGVDIAPVTSATTNAHASATARADRTVLASPLIVCARKPLMDRKPDGRSRVAVKRVSSLSNSRPRLACQALPYRANL
jgi:hypothetical protein